MSSSSALSSACTVCLAAALHPSSPTAVLIPSSGPGAAATAAAAATPGAAGSSSPTPLFPSPLRPPLLSPLPPGGPAASASSTGVAEEATRTSWAIWDCWYLVRFPRAPVRPAVSPDASFALPKLSLPLVGSCRSAEAGACEGAGGQAGGRVESNQSCVLGLAKPLRRQETSRYKLTTRLC